MQATANDTVVVHGQDCVLELTSCRIDGGEQISYTTYGIRVTDPAGMLLLQYQDVSTDRSMVESFLRLCGEHEVSSIHIPDILEDYLE